jgi:hypothetical protein
MPNRRPAFVSVAFLVAAVFVTTAAQAAAGNRVKIVDYGVYDHTVTEIIKDPKEVAGERSLVTNLHVREKTTLIDAQRGRMFGFQFRVTDPGLYGRTLVVRKIVPKLTNPKTGQTATVMDSEVVAEPGVLHLNAYGFDYDWERAEGTWTFQVLYQGKVLAEKKFKVILPMN